MAKRIHHKKWSKKFNRRELQGAWGLINMRQPNLKLKQLLRGDYV